MASDAALTPWRIDLDALNAVVAAAPTERPGA